MKDVVQCAVCGAEAEFISPRDMCRLHWAEWWVDGTIADGELSSRDAIIADTLTIIADELDESAGQTTKETDGT